ncbi:MAG: trypsin-like peptidase domain-containing protein [Lysobacteraceae bacterium]
MTHCSRLAVLVFAVASTAALAVPAAPIPSADPAPGLGGDTSIALGRARDAVLPHVVSILVVREDVQDGEPKLSVSSGSGTVIDPDGHVVTNAHVTDRGRSFRVVFGDGRERDASFVGQDTAADIAVLRVLGESRPMPHARFAVGHPLAPGETVVAMGAPWGLSNSLSAGVVNNPRRLLVSLFDDEADYEDQLDADAPTGRYYAWIQHDAAIAPGNSGGPLVDLDGNVVGVNTRGMLFGGDLAFAIPADDARSVAEALIAEGEVRRSTLGLRLRSLRGTGEREGVLVNAVERDGPAHRAGLAPGDRLLSIAGVAVDAPQAVDVPGIQRRIAELPSGTPVRLRVAAASGGAVREIETLPVLAPVDRGTLRAFAPFGMALQELTPAMSQRRRLPINAGLLVASLRAGGPATTARPPIPPGAVLLSADGRALRSMDDLSDWTAPVRPVRPVVLEWLQDGERRLSALVPSWGDRRRDPLPELPKAWTGAEVQPVPASLAVPLGLPSAGFRITRLYPGSALGAAGARVGDLLVAVDGDPLPALNDTRAELFAQRIRELEIGQKVRFDGFRGDQRQAWTVTLAPSPLPPSALRSMEQGVLRAQLRELGFYDRVERDLALDQTGVLVQSVEPGGPAGLAHLQAGDVLVRLGDRPVDGLDAIGPAMAAIARGSDDRFPIAILRRGESRIVHVERRWIQEPRP